MSETKKEPEAPKAQAAKPVSAPSTPQARTLAGIIEEAVEKGVRVMLAKGGYEVEGFYKEGAMSLVQSADGSLTAQDKKGNKTPIKDFDDLARLNFACWKNSRAKRVEWMTPQKEWLADFERLGLVKRQVIYVPADE